MNRGFSPLVTAFFFTRYPASTWKKATHLPVRVQNPRQAGPRSGPQKTPSIKGRHSPLLSCKTAFYPLNRVAVSVVKNQKIYQHKIFAEDSEFLVSCSQTQFRNENREIKNCRYGDRHSRERPPPWFPKSGLEAHFHPRRVLDLMDHTLFWE